MRALLDEEPGAWDFFVERHAGLVAGVARRLLRGRGLTGSQPDVDDITENVFVMLLERDAALLRSYDPRYALRSYLAVLTRTAVHRWLRRRRAKVDLPDAMWGDALPDEDAPAAPEATTRAELQGAVRDVLAQLPDRDQQVLRLFYYEGRDYHAIAQVLGVSVNSVGAALSRARARLARALAEHRDLTESDWRSI